MKMLYMSPDYCRDANFSVQANKTSDSFNQLKMARIILNYSFSKEFYSLEQNKNFQRIALNQEPNLQHQS